MENKLLKGLKVFADSDGVLCLHTDDLLKLKSVKMSYPYLQAIIDRFAWDVGPKLRIAYDDLLFALKACDETSNFKEFEAILKDKDIYINSGVCHVCGHVAFPDQEMYHCILTGRSVCTKHCSYSEEFGGYVTNLISEKA